MTTPTEFEGVLSGLASDIAGMPVDAALEDYLASTHPPGSPLFENIRAACEAGVDAGWLCAREADGVRFGRAIKPGPQTAGFSVDVVLMDAVEGPHHSHPNGEIDMIMPIDGAAEFDGKPAGWLVYGPGSAHSPTVTGGCALVLYLLPGGAIEFSRR